MGVQVTAFSQTSPTLNWLEDAHWPGKDFRHGDFLTVSRREGEVIRLTVDTEKLLQELLRDGQVCIASKRPDRLNHAQGAADRRLTSQKPGRPS